MKKLILGLALSYCALNIQAQELADKKTQLGFLAGLECNFQKMGTDRIQSNGIGSDFMIGINATIALNNNLAFNTGLEFDLESLKYKCKTFVIKEPQWGLCFIK